MKKFAQRLLAGGTLLALGQMGMAQSTSSISPFTGQSVEKNLEVAGSRASLPFATYLFLLEMTHYEKARPGIAMQRLTGQLGLNDAASRSIWNYAQTATQDDVRYQHQLTSAMCERNSPAMTTDILVEELVQFEIGVKLHQEQLGQGLLAVVRVEDKARLDSWLNIERESNWRTTTIEDIRANFQRVVSESSLGPAAFLQKHCAKVTEAQTLVL